MAHASLLTRPQVSRRNLLIRAAATAGAAGLLAACGGNTAAVTNASTTSAVPATATSVRSSSSGGGQASSAVVSASSSSSAVASAAAPSGVAALATTAAPRQGSRTLTLSGYGSNDTKQAFDVLAAKFAAQFAGRYSLEPSVNVDGTYVDKTLTMLSAGTPPDVLNLWAQYKPEWAQKGYVLDLTEHIQASKDANPSLYLKPMVDAMRFQGKFWGTAQDFNGKLLYLNTDLFTAKGIALPKDDWTYDDWRQIAKELTDPAQHRFGGNNDANQAGNQQFCVIYNFAKHYWVDTDQKKALISDQATIDCLTYFLQAAYNDQSLASALHPLPPNLGSSGGFATGNVAMAPGWGNFPYGIHLDTSKPGAAAFNWIWHPMPAGPQGQQHFSQGHLWSIAKANAHPDDAWVLAEWVGGLPGWTILAGQGKGQPLPMKDPALWSQYLSFLPTEQANQFRDFMINRLYGQLAVNFEYWPSYGPCSTVMGKALGDIYGKQPGSVQSAMVTAAQQMDAILARE